MHAFLLTPKSHDAIVKAQKQYSELYYKTTYVKKRENEKFEISLSDHDLYALTLYFLNHYKSSPAVWIDAVYFFLTLANGDRSYEIASDTNIEHIKVTVMFVHS